MRAASLATLVLIASALGAGCATSRGILDVSMAEVANPATGPAVTIASVRDARVFELRPTSPSTPSLKEGEIKNAAITSRAIARKRNSYGKAMGDILLPEGQTVEQLARAAVVAGLRDGGFRVLESGDPGVETAAPLDVRILQFWAWFSPGFWAAHLEFDSKLVVSGPIAPFENGEEFQGYVRLGTQMATGRAWLNTIEKGLGNLNTEMRSRLRGVANAPPAAPDPDP